jgi:cobyrinic acid a,c-diamide synthase
MPTNSFTFESRNLGLVTADEIGDLKDKLAELSTLAEEHIFLDELIEVSEASFPIFREPKLHIVEYNNRPIIAVAKDAAFCFVYSDNIALLEKLGCRIEYFSPLKDKKLPDDCCGLILSGGYPELYAEKLSQNNEMLQAVRSAINSGIPTIAECGGFMYLHENIILADDEIFGFVGAVKGDVYSTKKLQRFGYVTLEAKKDCLVCVESDKIAAHEFHYWDSTNCGSDFIARKSDGRNWECVHANKSTYAGFPHLYFYADVRIAERFVAACAEYGEKHGQNKQDRSH